MKYVIVSVAVLTVCFSISFASAQNRVVVVPLGSSVPNYGGVQVVTSAKGRVWMDRNLGALRPALNRVDQDAYGGYFQWGRLNDGHAWPLSSTTSFQSSSDVPGHDSFITGFPDWKNPSNDDLWQGESGINNPCPTGFRLPTESEWEVERLSWSSNDSAGAFASPLKLPLAGFRHIGDGMLNSIGHSGYYWCSTVSGSNTRVLYFDNTNASMIDYARAFGYSVRCIKD